MESNTFSSLEMDAIGEILNISLGASATAISNMLDRRVDITIPVVEIAKKENFEFEYMEPAVGVEINYVAGLSGQNVMLLKREDVKVIVEILMSTSFTDEEFELDELTMSAVCEVMNQMMGASATALSEVISEVVDISTPNAFEIATVKEFGEKYLSDATEMVVVRFTLTIQDALESEFLNVMGVDFAKKLLAGAGVEFPSADGAAPEAAAPAPAPAPESGGGAMSQAQMDQMMAGGAAGTPPPMGGGGTMSQAEIEQMMAAAAQPGMMQQGMMQQGMMPMQPMQPAGPSMVNVRPYSMEGYAQPGQENPESMGLIMDVPLEVSVEIGRTTKHVKEILAYNEGSLIVLDKLAGEHVDIYANGHQIAKGDVVVVDDCFGVRITEVIKRYGKEE